MYMHREIAASPKLPAVDHINGDTLDNRRANLRPVTASQNQQNRLGACRNSTTGRRGVFWRADRGKYQVRLRVDHKNVSIGYFASLDEADEAAKDARRVHMTHSVECTEVAS